MGRGLLPMYGKMVPEESPRDAAPENAGPQLETLGCSESELTDCKLTKNEISIVFFAPHHGVGIHSLPGNLLNIPSIGPL